jgi:outer membrane protein assembly factor BamA
MLVRYRNHLSLIHPLFAAVFICLSLSNLLAQQPASPGKLMIADVIVQGNRVVATQAITSQLATKPGKEYQPNVIQDDVRKLMATKQFAHIDPRIESLPDGKVNIFFLVNLLHLVNQSAQTTTKFI